MTDLEKDAEELISKMKGDYLSFMSGSCLIDREQGIRCAIICIERDIENYQLIIDSSEDCGNPAPDKLIDLFEESEQLLELLKNKL